MQSLYTKENGCDALITNDRDFYSCNIECMGSSEFLDKYARLP